MLPSAHRMRRSTEFSSVMRSGRRVARRSLVLHLGSTTTAMNAADASTSAPALGAPVANAPVLVPGRVGFIVSKAVGNAVTRNSVKRRLRHAVRPHLLQLPGDVVVRALPAAASSSFEQLSDDFSSALATGLRTGGQRSRSTR